VPKHEMIGLTLAEIVKIYIKKKTEAGHTPVGPAKPGGLKQYLFRTFKSGHRIHRRCGFRLRLYE